MARQDVALLALVAADAAVKVFIGAILQPGEVVVAEWFLAAYPCWFRIDVIVIAVV